MNFIETYSICCFDQTMNYTLASETFETDSSPIPALDNAMVSYLTVTCMCVCRMDVQSAVIVF